MSLSDAEIERYARHLVLRQVGGAGQARLGNARVLVIGAGGLGAPLLMYLAAAGVGTLGIVDDDIVALSNLQRQIIHDTQAIGTAKTASASHTIARINPHVRVIAHEMRLTHDNARKLVSQYDIIADGSDNFETRFRINDACFFEKKTLVSGALAQFDGQLATFKPHRTRDGGGHYPCYRCLFPEAPPPGAVQNCAEAGILGAIAGVVGALQATEVLKEILDIGETLAGRLLIYDALGAQIRSVKLNADPACALCGTKPTIAGVA